MSVLINMTYNGRSGNYLANIDEGLDDASIRRICEEAVLVKNGCPLRARLCAEEIAPQVVPCS